MEQRLLPSPHHLSPNRTKPMRNFEDFVFKLAQAACPNAPLPPSAATLLRDRLDSFVSKYETPDHPPYSAMIQTALKELNEKGGSSKKSISKYLEKSYERLPWAHPALLNRHLDEACRSGEIVVTRTKKYRLAGSPNVSTTVKSKPRQRRWRWECERQKHNQFKIRLIRKRNQLKDEKVDVIEEYQEHDEEEQPLTEIGMHGADQMKSLLTIVDGEKSSCSNPTILHAEPLGMIVSGSDRKYTEEEMQSQRENGLSAIAEEDIWAAHAPEHHEREQSEHDQLEISTPERPLGFELVIAGKLDQLGSTEPEPQCGSETYQKPQQVFDLNPITSNQMDHEKALIEVDVVGEAEPVKITRNGKRGWRRKNKPKPESAGELLSEKSKLLSATSDEPESAFSDERETQELLQQTPSPQEETLKQLCRSLRHCSATAKAAKSQPETHSVAVHRRRSWPSLKPMKATSMVRSQDSSKSRKKMMRLEQIPEAVAVDDCKEQDLKQSRNLDESTSVHDMEPCRLMEVSLPDNSKPSKEKRLELVPTRCSARLRKLKDEAS